MSPMEFGIISVPLPDRAVAAATAAEEDGYDVVLLPDSQNLFGDPYTELALIAKATSRIRLGTGVTNPVTRHPAVTAASIFSVHVESGGRAIFLDSPILGFFLDAHAARAHYANNPSKPGRNWGALQLGLDNTDFFL